MFYPKLNASLELVTDASNSAAGAVLHQVVDGAHQPLAFFSKKFSSVEAKKSAFDRELLAIFLTLKHYNWLLGQDFTIVTDHKPLTHALSMKNPTPQQSRWLSYIAEFNVQIKHVAGADNVVADHLSRSLNMIQGNESENDVLLAQEQVKDPELQEFFKHTTQQLVEFGSKGNVHFRDRFLRPFVPKGLRLQVFQDLHNLSHPGINATIRLIKKDYVWPNMCTDIQTWAKNCLDCQKSKITRHTKSEIGQIPSTARFHTVHIDFVGPLPPCKGFSYLFTMIDRFTKWPEVMPVPDMTTQSAIQALMHGWVSRYGIPRVIISDRGAQFESKLWNSLMQQLNIKRKRTTSYHPACNGAIERFHRTLKTSLRAVGASPDWISALPLVLLGIRSSINKEGFCPSQALYGSNLELPTHFFSPLPPTEDTMSDSYLKRLYTQISQFSAPNRKHPNTTYIPKDLSSATHVWVRNHTFANTFSPRYKGPFKVIHKTDKVITIEQQNKTETISIDHCKPAFMTEEPAQHTQNGRTDKHTDRDMDKLTRAQQHAPHLVDTHAHSATHSDQQMHAPNANAKSHSDKQMHTHTDTQTHRHTDTDTRSRITPWDLENLQPDQIFSAKFKNYPNWPVIIVDAALTPLANQRKLRDEVPVRLLGCNTFKYISKRSLSPYTKPAYIPDIYCNEAFLHASELIKGLELALIQPSKNLETNPLPSAPSKRVRFNPNLSQTRFFIGSAN